MRHRLFVIVLGAVALALPSCGEGDSDKSPDPLSAVIDASEQVTGSGPARIDVSVLGPAGRYQMSGQVDPGGGYRVCANIDRAPGGYLRGHTLWLEERNGTYATLTAPLPTRTPSPATRAECPRAGWFDDHPPTLPLYREGGIAVPPAGETDAEAFLHVALLALTQMKSSAIKASAQNCGDKTCYEVLLDFRHFDRRTPWGDEDLLTLRPLLRRLGRYQVKARVDSQGLIDRVQLMAPSLLSTDPTPSAVVVAIRLSDFGNAPVVPRVQARAIE